MLNKLFIQNYALIDALDFYPGEGFISITGETGAGKSILVGALSLILGKRADSAILYNKDRKCIVEGVWEISDSDSISEFFAKNDLDIESQITLRREISQTGKSRAFINDTPVSLTVLKELASCLVDVSSQHETLNLLSEEYQLDLIDDFSSLHSLRQKYFASYRLKNQLSNQIQHLEQEEIKILKEFDFFKFQLDELEMLKYSIGEYSFIEEQQKLAENAELIKLSLHEGIEIFSAEEQGILKQMDYLISRFRKISKFHSHLEQILERLISSFIELKDLNIEIENLQQEVEFEPAKLEEYNQRLNQINTLIYKHRLSNADDLIMLKTEIEEKLVSAENLTNKKLDLIQQLEEVNAETVKLAQELSSLRIKSFDKIEKSVGKILIELGMPDAIFKIRNAELENFNAKGKDSIEFLFSANKGIEVGPISKIASGGELSRFLLALKIIAGKENKVSTMIFDEIDSGISGTVAYAVGDKMRELSTFVQVISISHLAQIAGKANRQFKVFKQLKEDKTITSIKELTEEERIDELAVMISGIDNSEAAESTAREILMR